jgi:hypothetical protein
MPKQLKDLPKTFRIEGEAASLELTAASDESGKPKVRSFSMTAYTGGAMRLSGFYYPVVVDLTGVKVNGQKRPILYAHDSARIVGHSETIEVTAQRIKVSGKISGIGEDAQLVVATADNEFPWQASIGANAQRIEFVERGTTVKVNGKNFSGPGYVARESTLLEVSFVPLGADDATSATVAATLTEFDMNFAAWLKANGWGDESSLAENQVKVLKAAFEAEQNPETKPGETKPGDTKPVNASVPTFDPEAYAQQVREAHAKEANRIAAINAAVASHGVNTVKIDGKDVNLAAHAIEKNWTVDQAELAALRASRPIGPAIHSHGGGVPNAQILQAAICAEGKLPGAEKMFGDQIMQAAHTIFPRGISLQQIFLNAAWANGFHGRSFRDDPSAVLRAAFSTFEVVNILSNTANKFLLAGFEGVESTWRSIAAIRSVSDFKEITSYRLNGDMTYDQVGPDGELKHGKLSEESLGNKADTFGKMFSITRKDFINDDLGALTRVPMMLGRGGALKFNLIFWAAFMDNSTFFTTGKKNYMEGSTTNLSIDSLTAGEQLFLNMVDPDGNPLALTPEILLVPNALNVTATTLMNQTELRQDGNSAKTVYTTGNPHAGKFQPVRSSYLSNAAITGNSTTAWYLLANPNVMPVIEAAFLNGRETPIVESADADFSTLGVQMRGYHDFGVRKQEEKGAIKSKGAA